MTYTPITDTKVVAPVPVWTAPLNLKDNTIISAGWWNTVTSSTGSVGYLNSVTKTRANCNIFVAEWDLSIPKNSSATINPTIITFTSVSNGKYLGRKNGVISLPDKTPCLLIWRMWFYGEAVYTGYNQRTTLQKVSKVGKSQTLVTSTVASFFNRKYDASQTIISASYAVFSNLSTDRYYITASHGYHSAVKTKGYCHLIVNPGMV